MTDTEIIQKFADLENRIRYLEMTNGPTATWSERTTQGCSQEELTVVWKGDCSLSKSKHKTWKAKAEDIDPCNGITYNEVKE